MDEQPPHYDAIPRAAPPALQPQPQRHLPRLPRRRALLALCVVGALALAMALSRRARSVSHASYPLALRAESRCVCPRIYAPVCCESGEGPQTTMPNQCECACQPGGTVVSKGQCGPPAPPAPSPSKSPAANQTCACPRILAPVCCESDEGRETASNECLCACRPGGETISYGQCAAPPKPTPEPTCELALQETVPTGDCSKGRSCRANLVVNKKDGNVTVEAGYFIAPGAKGQKIMGVDKRTRRRVSAVKRSEALRWATKLLKMITHDLHKLECSGVCDVTEHMIAYAIMEAASVAATCPNTADERCSPLFTVAECAA